MTQDSQKCSLALHIAVWSHANNLTLNRSKSVEIVFSDKRRRHKISPRPVLPDIECVTSLKILSVMFTDRLSMSEHVQATVNTCASLLSALRVLQAHGMLDTALQMVYQATVMARLSMPPVLPGGVSRLRQTDRGWKPSLVLPRDVNSVMLININRLSHSSSRTPMTNYLRLLHYPEHTLYKLLPDHRQDITYTL